MLRITPFGSSNSGTQAACAVPRSRNWCWSIRSAGVPLGFALITIALSTASPAWAYTNADARIAVTIKSHATKSQCTTNAPQEACSGFVTEGAVGQSYDMYVFVANADPVAGVAGAAFGIDYDNVAGRGVDIYQWTRCSDLEFPGQGWPDAGGGNTITFVTPGNCQLTERGGEGVHAVLGWFYCYAYTDDTFEIVNRQITIPDMKVADCTAQENNLAGLGRGGIVEFSAGAATRGCNPCIAVDGQCPPAPPEERQTWVDASTPTLSDPDDCRAVAWGDYDGDGFEDLYLVKYGANRLLRNDGAGGFQDVTATTGATGDAGDSWAAAWADMDNDGDLDLFVANSGLNRLLRNDGGVFTDVTPAEMTDYGYGLATAWADYDLDGRIDLYLVNYGTANRLYHNLGGGTFSEATPTLLADTGGGAGAAWGDFDADGDPDLYLANSGTFGGANHLFRNEGGGTFTDVTAATGTSDSGSGFSVAWVDIDNDLDLDLFVANRGQANRLFRNGGTGVFTEIAGSVGIAYAGQSLGSCWGDFDNDGDLDLYVTNDGETNALYRNYFGNFYPWTGTSLGDTGSGAGAAAADYDNDGDLDLHLANRDSANRFFRNDQLVAATWLQVRLQGVASNQSGIGTQLRLQLATGSRLLEVTANGGLGSQSSLRQHFGFLSTQTIAAVEARWPSGVIQTVSYPTPNSILTLVEPEAFPITIDTDPTGLSIEVDGLPYVSPHTFTWNEGSSHAIGTSSPQMASADSRLDFRSWSDSGSQSHTITVPADSALYVATFIQQYTLTVSTTAGGGVSPASGWQDEGAIIPLTASPDPDYVFERWAGTGSGSYSGPDNPADVTMLGPITETAYFLLAFTEATVPPLDDSGAGRAIAWGDYDNDGDDDLYLVNDGPNRLFRNDAGTFTELGAAAGVADAGDGWCAAWADYDNDGFLDLYVSNNGSNHLYHSLGNGAFEDASTSPVNDAGYGQGCAWADYDRDGWVDLYLANNYSQDRLFRNDHGVFVDVSSGPVAHTGGGAGVTWGDYDGDGDPDIYLTRAGLFGEANALLRNDGGVFVDVTSGPLGDTGVSYGAAWVDYDADGDLDLYIANFGDPNRLLRNDGSGQFTDVTSTPMNDSGNSVGLAWGDYDNDGDPDLYVVNYGGPNGLYRNNGVAGFAQVAGAGLGDSGQGLAAAWADYDRDGDPDLYLANQGSNRLYRNNGGNANHWLQLTLHGVESNAAAIGARVRARGGVSSTVIVEGGSGFGCQNSLTQSLGLGALTSIDSLSIFWPSGRRQVLLGQEADTLLDILEPPPLLVLSTDPLPGRSTWGVGDTIRVALNQALQGPPPSQKVLAYGAQTGDLSYMVEISQGGTALSLIRQSAPFPGDRVNVLLKAGLRAGSGVELESAVQLGFRGPVVAGDPLFDASFYGDMVGSPAGTVLADLDGNGVLDLATALSAVDSVEVRMGDGFGGFSPGLRFPAGDGPVDVIACDMDQDSWLDLVTANWTSGDLSLLLNDQSGGMSPPVSVPVGETANTLAAADLNGDGWPDLVVVLPGSTPGSSALAVSLNQAGVPGTAVTYPLPATGGPVEIVDMEGDGDPDVVVGAYDPPALLTFVNDGAGALSPLPVLAVSSRIDGLAVGDLDGDGRDDLAAVGMDPSGDLLRLVSEDSTWVVEQTDQWGHGGISLSIGDLDGDGTLDLAAVQESPTPGFRALLAPFSPSVREVRLSLPGGASTEARNVSLGDLDGDGRLEAICLYRGGAIHVVHPSETATGIPGDDPGLKAGTGLHLSPNPLVQRTTIEFGLEAAAPVRLSVFDLRGRLVATLLESGTLPAGSYAVPWDGRNAQGHECGSGLYFVALDRGGNRTVQKLVLSR